jgi:hypothetical protein
MCQARRSIRPPAVGTSTAAADTDGDGFDDGQEVLTYGTNPLDADSDDDGVSDGDEIAAGTNPLDRTSFPQPVPALPQADAVALVAGLAALLARGLRPTRRSSRA